MNYKTGALGRCVLDVADQRRAQEIRDGKLKYGRCPRCRMLCYLRDGVPPVHQCGPARADADDPPRRRKKEPRRESPVCSGCGDDVPAGDDICESCLFMKKEPKEDREVVPLDSLAEREETTKDRDTRITNPYVRSKHDVPV